MGEVYRATDTKLSRDVALKVLPTQFVSNPERMARFEREAQVLASLNHPHIATIHGLEEAGDNRALVMELVEGPTLEDRIAGSLIPIDEFLSIAKQIAEALEYAHERGIIHRDLKPANVKLTRDGQIKVLDFGLAKALAPDTAPDNFSNSPTLSLAATQAGVILGTAAYMSPEQAKGKAVDRRADIWAFGVVLYEMLTKRMLFTGETASETMALVITKEPDWNALPSRIPPSIRELLRRCLVKDPRARLQSIGDARVLIEEAIANPEPSLPTITDREVPQWRRTVPWLLAGVLGLGLVFTMWMLRQPSPPSAPGVRLVADLGADGVLDNNWGSGAVLSPDGKLLAFSGINNTSSKIYVRPLDQLKAMPLAGTDGARNLFFSPDGRWIGFFASGKLKKISVSGGVAVSLCDAPDDRGGSWSDDDTIVFAPTTSSALSRISSAGGTPEPLTKLDASAGEFSHRWPQVLPGGRVVLYTMSSIGGVFDNASIVAVSLATGEKKILQRGGFYGRYLRSGHITYIHEATLFAIPFDLKRLELAGKAVPVIEGVSSVSGNGGAQFAFSDNGQAIYLPGSDTGNAALYWMDREGKTTPFRSTLANYLSPRFSPDGHRLAVQSLGDIWIDDWERDTMSRLTIDPAPDSFPVWTPDGRRIAFLSTRNNIQGIYWQRADGSGDVQLLTESKLGSLPRSFHPSGKFLAFDQSQPQTATDIMILPLEGDEKSGWKTGKPTVFFASPLIDTNAAFSPDGRWIAYQSSESGTFEVYVRPFPGPGGKWQISNGGGGFPVWSQTKKELFYRTFNQKIMIAPYRVAGDSFQAEQPRLLSEGQFTARGTSYNFDLHPDGQRFVVVKVPEGSSGTRSDQVIFIFNFFDELRRLAPAGL
jgi:serine/threonine protein kinase/WD40 repeat protein